MRSSRRHAPLPRQDFKDENRVQKPFSGRQPEAQVQVFPDYRDSRDLAEAERRETDDMDMDQVITWDQMFP